MNVVEEILRLAKEADQAIIKADSAGWSEFLACCRAIMKLARNGSEAREEICCAFQRILLEPHAGAWEVVMPAMHLLRWQEMKEWCEQQHRACIAANDWRGEPIYSKLLQAFSDDWVDRDLYIDLPPLMEPVSIIRVALPMARPCPLAEA